MTATRKDKKLGPTVDSHGLIASGQYAGLRFSIISPDYQDGRRISIRRGCETAGQESYLISARGENDNGRKA